jgi:hypothetical protein
MPHVYVEAAGDALAAAAGKAFEEMFFSPVEDHLDRLPEGETDLISAAVAFRGELSGIFRLTISTWGARRIAAAFLAADAPSLSSERIGEVVCELSNIICGCTLSHIAADALFELLSPRLEAAPGSKEESATAHVFQLEDGFARVSLCMH